MSMVIGLLGDYEMKSTQEIIEVMQAFAEGKEIERNAGFGEWMATDSPRWNWYDFDYRIAAKKPVLVPHWPAICKYKDSGNMYLADSLFPNLAEAKGVHSSAVRLATEYPPIMLEGV
jgi:hypothetical protein